jgi:segregation and condensation protein A
LLFLVRREGVDLRDVSIAPITDAFLAQLDLMTSLDLDVAADFLVMSSTLCLLKSRELLVQRGDAVEGIDDDIDVQKARLHRRLIDYQRYREAADTLASLPMLGRETFARTAQPSLGHTRPIEPGIDALGLLELFYGVLENRAVPHATHSVVREPVSIKDMADWLLGRLDHGPQDLSDLLRLLRRPEERVVAFLATLEMARVGMLDMAQTEHLGPVHVQGLSSRESVDLTMLFGGVG